MDETMEIELTSKQQFADQLAVTVLGGIAGLLASKAVAKGYNTVLTMYRLKKAAA